jgi:hypothetical protein
MPIINSASRWMSQQKENIVYFTVYHNVDEEEIYFNTNHVNIWGSKISTLHLKLNKLSLHPVWYV